MRISVIAVGKKMPDWVQAAVTEYAKRLRQEYSFEVIEIPNSVGAKNSNKDLKTQLEAKDILAKIRPSDRVIALEVEGERLTTHAVSKKLARLKTSGDNLKFVIGGADGLHESCLLRADERWSLSDLTMTHSLARIVLAEQLYRADTILRGHPYHRA